jgi:hypothetical protein
VVGDLPALAFAMRLNTETTAVSNQNISFYNNIWSDPTGTMGAENPTRPNDFSDTPMGQTSSFTLETNLYWNGGAAVPEDPDELVNYTDDPNRIVADPLLPSPTGIILPRWQGNGFAGGADTIREAFVQVVGFGMPGPGAPVVDAADPAQAPGEDILGNVRVVPDIGAAELFNAPYVVYLPVTQD